MSWWLFQEILEKRGLAYSVYSTSLPMKDFGLFYVYAGCEKKNLNQVIDLILEQFKKIKNHGISKEELYRSKEHLKGGLVLGLESSSSRMSYIAKSEYYYGRTITIEEVFDEIDKVTNDDIVKLSESIFKEQFMTLTLIGDLESCPKPSLKI